MPYIEFPRWMYHPELSPRIVQDKTEQIALGPGWFKSRHEALEAAVQAAEAVPAPTAETPTRRRKTK
jgi:hypothetical protein